MVVSPETYSLQKCLANAAAEVFATTAGIIIYQTHGSTSEAKIGGVELTGAIMLQGERSAILSLKISKEYASVVVAAMTGLAPLELSNEDLYDGVAELVNMIAGKIKVCMEGTGRCYSLTQPFTIVGENVSIIYKEQVPQKITLSFNSGETELYLVLTFL